MNRNPFKFGEIVTGDYFAGRYREKELITAELSANHNVIICGPAQFGKTSIARKVMSELEKKGVITIYIDLERGYSPIRFIEIFLSELLRAAFRQTKDLRSFIDSLEPELKEKLKLKIESNDELIIDLQEDSNLEEMAAAVLELSEQTAVYKKRACVVCFDELSEGGNHTEKFRQQMIAAAKKHENVGYLLINLQAPTQQELNKQGITPIILEKIEERYFKGYIKTRFENTGFRITEEVIDELLTLSESHPHFTQMLCSKLWDQWYSGKIISGKSIIRAVDEILEINNEYYASLWKDLSLHQKNLLLAVAQGGGQKIFSQEFVGRFGLGSFSTVQKSLSRLLTKHIFERRDDSYIIRDIFFSQWLARKIY